MTFEVEMKRSNGEGSLLKVKNSKYWRIQYYHNGRQIRVSAKTTVKSEAQAMLRKMLDAADKGLAPMNQVRKLKYRDLRTLLIDSYIASGNKSLLTKADGNETVPGLAALDSFFEGWNVIEITSDSARKFVRARQAEGVGNAVINRSLACLRRMLKLAHREGKIHNVPFIEFLREPHAREGFLERDGYEKIMNLLPTHLRPLICLLYSTGCRVGEALQITWEQVDLGSSVIRLKSAQTKNSEARVLPMHAELVMLLSDIPETSRNGLVFEDTNLRKEWVKACVAAGLGNVTKVEGKPSDPIYSGLTLHDLRRSAIRNMVRAGIAQSTIMKISGHKTVSVFMRYAVHSEDDLTAAMQKVEVAALGEANAKAALSSNG